MVLYHYNCCIEMYFSLADRLIMSSQDDASYGLYLYLQNHYCDSYKHTGRIVTETIYRMEIEEGPVGGNWCSGGRLELPYLRQGDLEVREGGRNPTIDVAKYRRGGGREGV